MLTCCEMKCISLAKGTVGKRPDGAGAQLNVCKKNDNLKTGM